MRTGSIYKLLLPLTVMLLSARVYPEAGVGIFSADDLAEAITGHTLTFDFILIDVRGSGECSAGIIASNYCRPYHLPWSGGEFQAAFRKIDTGFPVLIYDQTGSLAMQAARMLVDSGYTIVAAISGGMNAYEGPLADTTWFNAPAILPQPSYFGDLSAVSRHVNTAASAGILRNNVIRSRICTVTLQGCAMPCNGKRTFAHSIVISADGLHTIKRLTGF